MAAFFIFFAKIAWCICYTLVGRWNNFGRNLVVMFQLIGVGQVEDREGGKKAPNTEQLIAEINLNAASGALSPEVLNELRAQRSHLNQAGEPIAKVSSKDIARLAREVTRGIG
jgi:hypothetical protein